MVQELNWTNPPRIPECVDRLAHPQGPFVGVSRERGFIFNMSVGTAWRYPEPTVQRFLDKMQYCLKEDREDRTAGRIYPRVKTLDIADGITDNITISTCTAVRGRGGKNRPLFHRGAQAQHHDQLNPTLLARSGTRDSQQRFGLRNAGA